MVGAGKYDNEATLVRMMTGATLVALIVNGGERGPGFALQLEAGGPQTLADLTAVVNVLRDVASQIERDVERLRACD